MALLFLMFYIFDKIKNEGKNVVFSKETNYYKIRVVDIDNFLNFSNSRILFLDSDSHSVENKNGEDLPIYTNIYPVFTVFNKNIKDIFTIGGGSYSIAKRFSEFYPESKVSVSEIDPEVTKTAENYFNLKQYPINTIFEDGRVYLQKNEKKYDLIFGDAYNSFITVPWHLMTFEFNELVKSRLEKDGVYAVNFISTLKDENDFFKSMLTTFKKTFDNFYIFVYGETEENPQNIILVGVNSDKTMGYDELLKEVGKVKNGEFLSQRIIPNNSLKNLSNTLVLRDDFSPVEFLMLPLVDQYLKYNTKFFYALF